MGLDYSFNLFFHVQDPWQIMEGLGAMAVPRLDVVTPIIYPDRILYLPFEAWAGTETRLPIHYSDREDAYDFMTVLSFEPDPELLDYSDRDTPQITDKNQRVEIGYIYMTLYPNSCAYAEDFDPWLIMIRLTAATSNMSILFLESLSMRSAFVDLLERFKGVYGLIDREEEGTLFWLRGQTMDVNIPDAYMNLRSIESYLHHQT
jgi:hypothetical protein